VVRQDAVVGPLLPLVAIVAPRLPLVAFDVDVVAVVAHITIAPMVQPLATPHFEHSGNHQSRRRLLQG
jgi:hypothetical protein